MRQGYRRLLNRKKNAMDGIGWHAGLPGRDTAENKIIGVWIKYPLMFLPVYPRENNDSMPRKGEGERERERERDLVGGICSGIIEWVIF